MIDSNRAVNGDFEIESLLRRHQCFVAQQEGRSYFIKTAPDASRARALANEARLYVQLKASENPFHYMPSLLDYDEDRGILVIDYVDGRPLREIVYETDGIHRSTARQIAICLGDLHATPKPSAELLPRIPLPWVFAIHEPSIDFVNEMSFATKALVKIIHADEMYRQLIASAGEAWAHDAVIHNDVRWDNLIADTSLDQLWLVDWELGGVGDASWDLAAVVCEFLSLWLHSIPVLPDTSHEDWVALAEIPLHSLLPALSLFFDAYLTTRGIKASHAVKWLDRSLTFAGIRLIQAAIEQSQLSSTLSAYSMLALQLSFNILLDPGAARRDLLKIDIE